MKKFLILAIPAVVALFALNNCSSSGGGGTATLTTAGKMTTGIDSSVSTIQSVGGTMGTGTFFNASGLNSGRAISVLSAATKCTTNGEPGDDLDSDGEVEDSEKYNTADPNFVLQSFYCSMAAETDGPEAVSGAVSLVKTIVCALERQLGTLPFDGVAQAVSSITIDTNCTTQADIEEMSGTPGATSFSIPVAATVTTALNPTFAEAPSNTHYTHGIRIASDDGTSIKFVLLAKFDASLPGDPIESGEFEFATLGTGTVMQGTAIEFTAGKITGTGATKHLWYEFRANRFKATTNDALCPNDSGSCGWGRHLRLSTDIEFSGGDVSNVSNFSGILSEANDTVGSGGASNQTRVSTAKGSLSTGISGKIWTSGSSGKTITGALSSMTAGTHTCITGPGIPVSTSCGGLTAYEPTGNTENYVRPANTAAWFANASTKGGLGFSGDAAFTDEQFVNP